MVEQYFGGVVPESDLSTERTQEVLKTIFLVDAALDANKFTVAVETCAALVTAIDGYITANAPWKLAKDEAQRDPLAAVLRTAVKAIRILTALLYPVLPFTTEAVWQQLGLGSLRRAVENGELLDLTHGGFPTNARLGSLKPLFPRADKETLTRMSQAEQQLTAPLGEASPSQQEQAQPSAIPDTHAEQVDPTTQKLAPMTEATTADHTIAATSEQASAKPDTPEITIEDFAKVDLRVAQVLVAERIPKANKLLRLEVDLGYEKRQILAGIAQSYEPEKLVGRKVVIVANLAPRKLRGLESQGMIVAASIGDGIPALASFLEPIELGARLK